MITLEQKTRKIAHLTFPEWNPRIIKDSQFQALKKSIKEDFDFLNARPVIVSIRTGSPVIVAGNMRAHAAKDLGIEEIPVIEGDIPEAKEKEWAVKDNLHRGEWDWDKLANSFDTETLFDWGFTKKDLGLQFDMAKKDQDEDFEDAETRKEVRAQYGTIYKLGNHRIMCGDATKKKHVEALMAGKKADLVWIDPPYNVNYSGKGKETSDKIIGDNQEDDSFLCFLQNIFDNCAEFTKETAPLYTCYASRNSRAFEDALNLNGWEVRNQIIWVKLVATMGWGDYRWKHEPIFYCFKKGASIPFYGDRKQYTEWTEEKTDDELLRMIKKMISKDEDGNSTIWRFNRETNYKHPMQKPVALVEKAIMNSSRINDIVLDICGGSGSTMIACEKLERASFLMDLDPKYVDVMIDRYCNYTHAEKEKIYDSAVQVVPENSPVTAG